MHLNVSSLPSKLTNPFCLPLKRNMKTPLVSEKASLICIDFIKMLFKKTIYNRFDKVLKQIRNGVPQRFWEKQKNKTFGYRIK